VREPADRPRPQGPKPRSDDQRPVVTIVQKTLPHYRVPFFTLLRSALDEHGVTLRLLAGQPDGVTSTRNDAGRLEWCEGYANRYLPMNRRHLIWQPVLRQLRGSDLVIVEQASKLLVNYLLMGWRRLPRGPRLAFWGHGRNLDQVSASRLGEAGKRALADQADWWFCYTEGTANLLESFGVNRHKMTVVQNTADTHSLRRARESLGPAEFTAVRAELCIGDGPIAVSIGSIYPAKRPEYLVEAADHLRQRVPGFELIVIGDGPDRHLLDAAATSRPWVHVLGAVLGEDVARWASPASVLLNPGVVGLTVVDAFALGLPMITCGVPGHGPEIEYLEDGVNGVILSEGIMPQGYATEVADLLNDHNRLQALSQGAWAAAERYTMDEMVWRFADGILEALSTPHAGHSSRHEPAASWRSSSSGGETTEVETMIGEDRASAVRTGCVCGVEIAAVTLDQAADAIVDAAVRRVSMQVHLCNAYTLSLVNQDGDLREALAVADLNLPDGTPVAWLLRGDGAAGPVRGPDLVPAVARHGVGEGVRHYFWGGAEGVAADAAARLEELAPGTLVVGCESPPFRDLTDSEILALGQRLTDSGADILWVGLGTPRQDYVVPRLGALFDGPVVPVGAAFDFLAGTVVEAPRFLRGTGLEWIHRLVREPRRLWRRYLIGNPRFLVAVVRDRFRGAPGPQSTSGA